MKKDVGLGGTNPEGRGGKKDKKTLMLGSYCRFEVGAGESGHERRWTTTESKTREGKQEPEQAGEKQQKEG